MVDINRLQNDFELVKKILSEAPEINKFARIAPDEYQIRGQKLYQALADNDLDVGLVFSDEHYCGDVPYLCGNCNLTVEQVAAVVGRNGTHLIAGLEGGYVAEQLAKDYPVSVHKAELLQLADEKYPVAAEKFEDILAIANGGTMPEKIALLTPRQVIPASLVDYCQQLAQVVDAQQLYYRLKYEKSLAEQALIRQAGKISDVIMRVMLAVLKPGMLETQVAAWGYFAAREMGAEELGFDIMVGANEANRSLIGKALNREIKYGDWVHLGVGAKCDGLNSCIRRSVIAVNAPDEVTAEQNYFFDLVEGAYRTGEEAYCRVAKENLPAKLQEQSLLDYFAGKADEVSRKFGKKIDLARLKPYTGTHNSGYTECQEFFGAITLESEEPLGENIVTMLDVALRGIGNHWDEVIIPGFDYLVIENTLIKTGKEVEVVTKLPVNVQHLVGNAG
ncbi:MAG: M24 family metallopeptidase [Lentisphaerae bacterium]|nr:M24 family metallopeptidase [Lentisphaerota bacterium]